MTLAVNSDSLVLGMWIGALAAAAGSLLYREWRRRQR